MVNLPGFRPKFSFLFLSLSLASFLLILTNQPTLINQSVYLPGSVEKAGGGHVYHCVDERRYLIKNSGEDNKKMTGSNSQKTKQQTALVRASDWIVECGDFQSSDIMRHQLGREVVPPRWPERMAINKSPVSWKAILIRVSALASLYVIGSTLRVLHVDFSVKCSRERTQECVGGGRSIHDTIKRGQKTD